jgi:hypothetical protein
MRRNKLVENYNEIEAGVSAVHRMVVNTADAEIIEQRMDQLEAKQADLKQTLQHLIALSKIRDEAWKALSHGHPPEIIRDGVGVEVQIGRR